MVEVLGLPEYFLRQYKSDQSFIIHQHQLFQEQHKSLVEQDLIIKKLRDLNSAEVLSKNIDLLAMDLIFLMFYAIDPCHRNEFIGTVIELSII